MRHRKQPSPDRLLDLERRLWKGGVDLIAGIDEAGRGPLAGPVVAAAVVFPKGLFVEGVTDSKQLSERRRVELFERICHEALGIGVGIIDHSAIDAMNIRRATMEAMLTAVNTLRVRPHFLLIDGDFSLKQEIPCRNIIRGDQRSFTIGAASIVAKVTRDRLMVEYGRMFPQYNFGKHKGYGTREHAEAIRKFGLCSIHRKSFRCDGWKRID
ncbi:MAG TPA: ribonuclease HII [Bacteroidota bacterium]